MWHSTLTNKIQVDQNRHFFIVFDQITNLGNSYLHLVSTFGGRFQHILLFCFFFVLFCVFFMFFKPIFKLRVL